MSTREKLIQARVDASTGRRAPEHQPGVQDRRDRARSHFYEIKDAFEKYGRDGLAPQPRRRPRMPNQTPPEIEQQILAMTRQYPTYSYVKIADQLKLIGVPAAASAVRGVWLRQGLLKRYDRLLWLEREAAVSGGPLTERVARLLARYQRLRRRATMTTSLASVRSSHSCVGGRTVVGHISGPRRGVGAARDKDHRSTTIQIPL